jgi:hypothetical protein
MSADLQHTNTLAPGTTVRVKFISLSTTIAALYGFVLFTVSLGTGFALYQNWTLRGVGQCALVALSPHG